MGQIINIDFITGKRLPEGVMQLPLGSVRRRKNNPFFESGVSGYEQIASVIYSLERVHEDIEEAIGRDRSYFLERRGELIELLDQLKERVEDE